MYFFKTNFKSGDQKVLS